MHDPRSLRFLAAALFFLLRGAGACQIAGLLIVLLPVPAAAPRNKDELCNRRRLLSPQNFKTSRPSSHYIPHSSPCVGTAYRNPARNESPETSGFLRVIAFFCAFVDFTVNQSNAYGEVITQYCFFYLYLLLSPSEKLITDFLALVMLFAPHNKIDVR